MFTEQSFERQVRCLLRYSMNWKQIDRIAAAFVFLYALVLYTLTVAPTASFWDAGEFIAIASGLQVSHPPGAPFYMLVGRLFAMFVPQSVVSLSINMVSVLCSAVTILLTYWIIVRLVREFQSADQSAREHFAAIAGGVVGACTFAVTDSFWFNAVEAEVYAMSMLFTTLVVWLIMRWSDLARASARRGVVLGKRENRILVLVAYLFGLAIGAHLLSLLALFFIALIIFFVKFDREEWTRAGRSEWLSPRRWGGLAAALIIASVVFAIIYPGIVQKLPVLAGRTEWPLVVLLGISFAVLGLVYLTHVWKRPVFNLASVCLLVVLIGYSTYALIFIRSAANPPIDENDPENPAAIVSYLAREQYGETPLLRGPAFDGGPNPTYREKNLPRRYSPASHHRRVYAQYDSDWDFFWKYQVGHMYVRYFLWQFSGRESDIQDARAITGIPFLDGPYESFFQTPSERASRNKYFALPLLLGLLGMMYHFTRDWRRAFSVLVLFLMTGIGIVLYLNQTPMQPRERDYSYVASFFTFSLWIGIGATGLIQMVADAVRTNLRSVASWGTASMVLIAVPGLMILQNYDDHDRSGRYVAPEYAYNMLNSVDQNGIVFTNGDNDTFPLWYLQEVEGVRRDVRVANLSLLNTPWYIRQLKHQWSRESAPLPITMDDAQIEGIGLQRWTPRVVSLPVDTVQLTDDLEVFGRPMDAQRLQSPMQWTLNGRNFGQDANGDPVNALYAADQAVLDILVTNALQGWTRPVYFAVTVSPDGRLNLENHFQLEGQAYRIVPIEHDLPMGRIDTQLSPEVLRRFKFTNLNNPGVYYDENIRRMIDNYRNVFSQTAIGLSDEGRTDEAIALMDHIMAAVPYETIPGDISSFVFPARAYELAGRLDKAKEIMQSAEPYLLHHLNTAGNPSEQQRLFYMAQQVERVYVAARDFEAYADFRTKINALVGDPTVVTPEAARSTFEGDTASIGESMDEEGADEESMETNMDTVPSSGAGDPNE